MARGRFHQADHERAAALLDPEGKPWIIRRIERLTLYQDHAVQHDVRFDCDPTVRISDTNRGVGRWMRTRQGAAEEPWLVPLFYLPKRRLRACVDRA